MVKKVSSIFEKFTNQQLTEVRDRFEKKGDEDEEVKMTGIQYEQEFNKKK